jgi:uncharacterized protein (TIGR02996 family)
MGHVDVLLQRVIAAPDDLHARQVYADALHEQGDPRGEFIQLQLQAEALSPGDPNRAKAERAAAKIEKAHRRAWLDELPMVRQGTYRSGLLHEVVATADPFFAGVDELFRRAPIRGVKLTKLKKAHLPKLVGLLKAHALESLDLSANRLDGAQLARIFAEADFSRLRRLALIDDPIDEEGCRAIVAREPTRLERLELGGSMCGQPGEAALAALLEMKSVRLRELALSYFGIETAGAKSLAAAPILDGVEVLNLQSNHIDDEGVEALAASTHLRNLRRLGLGHSGMGDAGVRALLASPILDHIERDPPWALIVWDRNKLISKTWRAKLEARLGPKVVGW